MRREVTYVHGLQIDLLRWRKYGYVAAHLDGIEKDKRAKCAAICASILRYRDHKPTQITFHLGSLGRGRVKAGGEERISIEAALSARTILAQHWSALVADERAQSEDGDG